MSKILVSGSLAYDRIMDFDGHFRDHFLADKMHAISLSFQVETTAVNFGGTAGNIAYNLALLGHEPRIVATAGSDFAEYTKYLKAHGIDSMSIKVDKNGLTSAAFVMTDKDDNQIAAFSMGVGKAPYVPLPEPDGVRLAIIGAGSVADMKALPEHYRLNDLPYMYDPGQAIPALSGEELRNGLAGASVFFANDYEFGLVLSKTGLSEEELLGATPVIVVTYGEKGSRVRTSKGDETIPAVPVKKAVDPTGAGDAYRAGFIAAHLRGIAPDGCARAGSAVAAYAVEMHGTQSHSFTIPELADRYERAYGETISI